MFGDCFRVSPGIESRSTSVSELTGTLLISNSLSEDMSLFSLNKQRVIWLAANKETKVSSNFQLAAAAGGVHSCNCMLMDNPAGRALTMSLGWVWMMKLLIWTYSMKQKLDEYKVNEFRDQWSHCGIDGGQYRWKEGGKSFEDPPIFWVEMIYGHLPGVILYWLILVSWMHTI